jgi:hypothetical protein
VIEATVICFNLNNLAKLEVFSEELNDLQAQGMQQASYCKRTNEAVEELHQYPGIPDLHTTLQTRCAKHMIFDSSGVQNKHLQAANHKRILSYSKTAVFNETHMVKSKQFVDLSQETRDMWRPEGVTNMAGQL